MSWVFIFWANLSKSVCVARSREDMKRFKSSVLGFHNPPPLLFSKHRLQWCLCRDHMKRNTQCQKRSALNSCMMQLNASYHSWMQPTTLSLNPALRDGFIFPALQRMWCHHTHHNNSVYFLLIVLRTRGESWESKVKGEEMTYFLGYFCADKKLILIKQLWNPSNPRNVKVTHY